MLRPATRSAHSPHIADIWKPVFAQPGYPSPKRQMPAVCSGAWCCSFRPARRESSSPISSVRSRRRHGRQGKCGGRMRTRPAATQGSWSPWLLVTSTAGGQPRLRAHRLRIAPHMAACYSACPKRPVPAEGGRLHRNRQQSGVEPGYPRPGSSRHPMRRGICERVPGVSSPGTPAASGSAAGTLGGPTSAPAAHASAPDCR